METNDTSLLQVRYKNGATLSLSLSLSSLPKLNDFLQHSTSNAQKGRKRKEGKRRICLPIVLRSADFAFQKQEQTLSEDLRQKLDKVEWSH